MAITGFGLPGVVELLLIAVLGTGIGVPLGVPPQDPDPWMTQIAPEKCVYFATWMGMAQPDPESPNQTEQLLAEPEIVAFIQEVQQAAERAANLVAADAPLGEMALIARNTPLLFQTLITHPTTIFVEHVSPGPPGVDAKGALVVKLGDEAAEVGGIVEQFLGTAPPEISRKVEIDGVDCIELRLDPTVPKITVGQRDDYLIVAVGDGSFSEVLERGGSPPPQWLTDAMQSLTVPRVSAFAYADLELVFDITAQFGGPEVGQTLDLLGLTTMSTAVSVSGLDETGFVSRSKITSSDPGKGIGAFLSAKPLTAQDLSGIPQDASIALALRMDLQQVFHKSIEVVEGIDPRAADEFRMMLPQMAQMMGIDIEGDVLESLGDVWTLHAAPSGGGLAAGWTLAVSLKDAKKAQETHQKLLRFVNAVFDQQFDAPQIREIEHRGETAYTLEVPDDDFFIAPTWCVTESHLVVTLLPQTMKSYLNQAKADRSLADLPVVANALEKGPISLSYQDVRAQFVMFYPLLQYGAQVITKEMRRSGFNFDVTALPSIPAVAPHLLPTVSMARKVDDGFESYSHTTLPGANLGASAPVMVALLVPAILQMRDASRRAQSTNHLKQVGLAMHNYHDVYRAMPAAYSTDENGKPLLSWRVHVLPFIEHSQLYDQFHLDEPWDSVHNRKLIAQMPAVYKSPTSKADPGKTVYLGNASEGGIFVPPKENGPAKKPTGTGFRDISDGTSNTIMVIEAADPSAVIWTKPDDFELDEDNPFRGLAGNQPGQFMAAYCDGSVRPVSLTIAPETLKAIFTRAGGEVVNRRELR